MVFYYFDIMFFFVVICFINFYKLIKNVLNILKKCFYIIIVYIIINDKNVVLIKVL